MTTSSLWGWPAAEASLDDLQRRLAEAAAQARIAHQWRLPDAPVVCGGCFVVHPRWTSGPGRAGDRAWAAAVAWRSDGADRSSPRRPDRHLVGTPAHGRPRRADDVLAQQVVVDRSPAPYVPGRLAARVGAMLAVALSGLEVPPEVVLVDATGLDHPRRAGLAVHLGAVTGLPTVGVTRRPLLATGSLPERRRHEVSPLWLEGRCVAYWVCTRTGARPLVAHAGWRTSPETAARVVLRASTPAARTPVPLQEARRVAREARAADAG